MSKVQNLIENKGGTFVNVFYENSRKYVVFECQNSHLNEKRVDTMTGKGKTGSTWCSDCNRNTILDAYDLARKKGFRFLSKSYTDANTKYLWECSDGHQWKAKYGNIYSGRGCPQCLRVSYRDVVELARSKGGKCLTSEDAFVSTVQTKIRWKCAEGHQWTTTYGSVKNGNSWCSKCNDTIGERTCRRILEFIYKKKFLKKRPKWLTSSRGGRLELDGFNEELGIAYEYNGSQHYKFVPYWHKTRARFEWQKQKDQETEALCRERGVHLIVIPYTVKYKDLYSYILERCPDPPPDTPRVIDYQVLNVKSLQKSTLSDIQDYVQCNFGGTLLSKLYVNNTTRLKFRCKDGHIFQQTWGSILANIFCKKCTYASVRQDMQIHATLFAEENHFTLLDPYQKAKTKLRWKCQKCDQIITRSWDSMRKYNRNHC